MTTPTHKALEAARRVVREALDDAQVHPCDHENDSIRARCLFGSMRDLYEALTALSSELSQPAEAAPAVPAEVVKDAERYRWLRDQADFMRIKEGSPQVCLTDEWGDIVSTLPSAYPRGEKLDGIIDAAIGKEQS